MKRKLRNQYDLTVHHVKHNVLATQAMREAKFPATPKLLGSSTKIVKGEGKGVLTAVLYLAPANESGRNMCPWATAECAAACLGHSSGRMVFDTAKNSRVWKTALFLYYRQLFNAMLAEELAAHERKAKRLGLTPAVRLNGTSDVVPAWEWAENWPTIQFYDYTKNAKRALASQSWVASPNYHVTLSFDGKNTSDCVNVLRQGGNVAVVFDKLPAELWGFPVLDADETDIRFEDPPGHVAGLKFKGNKRDMAGDFVVKA